MNRRNFLASMLTPFAPVKAKPKPKASWDALYDAAYQSGTLTKEEICRLYAVPLDMVGNLSRVSYK